MIMCILHLTFRYVVLVFPEKIKLLSIRALPTSPAQFIHSFIPFRCHWGSKNTTFPHYRYGGRPKKDQDDPLAMAKWRKNKWFIHLRVANPLIHSAIKASRGVKVEDEEEKKPFVHCYCLPHLSYSIRSSSSSAGCAVTKACEEELLLNDELWTRRYTQWHHSSSVLCQR